MYTVRILSEQDQFVARDKDGEWRTKCWKAGAPQSGRDLAEWLFHKCEIGDVRIVNDITEVDVLEGCDA